MSRAPAPPTSFRRYLVWLGFCLAAASLLLLGALRFAAETLPPPPFTGSVSFDEKAVWLASRLNGPCEILAVGSSMTVNNLESNVFEGMALLNASSWGMKIQQTDFFLEILLPLVQPRTVLMLTAPTDFERDHRGREIFDREVLTDYLESGDEFRAHLRLLSLNYLLGALPVVTRDRHGRGTYYSLDFDRGGAVPLDLMEEGFERVPERWDKPIARESEMDEANHAALAALAARCRERGIRFVLVQGPIRPDILTGEDAAFLEGVHWPRLARICRENEAEFLNYHGVLPVSEDDFADSTHLNRQGALKLSRAIREALERPETDVPGLTGAEVP